MIVQGAFILLPVLFMLNNWKQYAKLTNTSQIYALTGWQMASNALHAYAKVPKTNRKDGPMKFAKLERIVNTHLDSLAKLKNRPDSILGAYYLLHEKAPLKQYLSESFKTDTVTNSFNKWASLGPFYKEYAFQVIMNYPTEFIQYFVFENVNNYFDPPSEFLGEDNMRRDSVENLAKYWFNWKNNKIYSAFDNKQIILTEIYPLLITVINIVFTLSLISFIILGGLKVCNPVVAKCLIITLIILFMNFVLMIVGSPIVLRDMIFPFLVTFNFMLIPLGFIIHESKRHTQTKDSFTELPQLT